MALSNTRAAGQRLPLEKNKSFRIMERWEVILVPYDLTGEQRLMSGVARLVFLDILFGG